MSTATELLSQFGKAVETKNTGEFARIRESILALELDSPENVMAHYRLALYVLHQEKNLNEVMSLLQKICTANIPCAETTQARISYAICLRAKGKLQQAIFELRKVFNETQKNTLVQTMALDYLATFSREANAPADTVAKINDERIAQLTHLATHSTNKDDKAQATIRLAAALEERNQKGDTERARTLFTDVAKHSSDIEKPSRAAAKDAVKRYAQKR